MRACYWLLVGACSAEAVWQGVDGSGWRAGMLAVAALLLLALHGQLDAS